MKNFTKLMAVILVCIIALSSAACSLTPQWSYKTNDIELPIGVYIYNMYNAYSQAQTLAQETESYNQETQTYDGEDSFLKVQITDEEGVTATADQWIIDQTDKSMKTILAIEEEFNRLGATIDQTTMDGYKASAKEYWEYGPYYSMYGEQYKNPYKDIFEPLGVSYESFEYVTISAAKQEAIFEKIYGEDGEKAVAEKELKTFFEDNYTSYTYFNSNLYESQEATGDTAQGALSSALSKEEIKKYEDNYKGYVNSANGGTKVEDVTAQFKEDYKLEEDPSTSNIEILENSSIGEDLVKAIEKLDEGKASYEIIGEENSQVIYFFYKKPIKNETKTYFEDEANKKSVLQNMKGDEFKAYMDDLANAIEVTVNDGVVDKYSPEMFEE